MDKIIHKTTRVAVGLFVIAIAAAVVFVLMFLGGLFRLWRGR